MKRCRSNLRKTLFCLLAGMCVGKCLISAAAAPNIPVDLSGYSPTCGVQIRTRATRIEVNWPMSQGEWGRASFNLIPGRPLIESLAIANDASGEGEPLLQEVEPTTFLTVGTREAPSGR